MNATDQTTVEQLLEQFDTYDAGGGFGLAKGPSGRWTITLAGKHLGQWERLQNGLDIASDDEQLREWGSARVAITQLNWIRRNPPAWLSQLLQESPELTRPAERPAAESTQLQQLGERIRKALDDQDGATRTEQHWTKDDGAELIADLLGMKQPIQRAGQMHRIDDCDEFLDQLSIALIRILGCLVTFDDQVDARLERLLQEGVGR